jgi:hypothetical protein
MASIFIFIIILWWVLTSPAHVKQMLILKAWEISDLQIFLSGLDIYLQPIHPIILPREGFLSI